MADDPEKSPPTPPPAVNRRSTLEYFNQYRASDRFWRMFSSREKVIENLKTLAWVVPITIIIWIYAEREQIVVPTGPNVTNVAVKVFSNDVNRSVQMLGNAEPVDPITGTLPVNLKLTGPQQAIENVREQLLSRIPRGLNIDIGNSLSIANNQPVNVVERIQNMDVFRSNGVTVQDAQPPYIYVNVDKLVHRELPVEIQPEITNLTGDTHFDPSTVSVSGPESVLDDQVKNHGLKVYANLVGSEVLKKQGSQTLPSVPLVFSLPQDKLRIDPPATVKASIVVRASDVDYVIETMSIWYEITPQTLKDFDLNMTKQSIFNTHVSGPQDKINELMDGTFKPEAVLEVIPDDSNSPTASKKLAYKLPPGVSVSDEDANRTVEFTLVRKVAGGI